MSEAHRLRNRLVDRLRAAGLLPEPRLEAAFRSVPRHLYLPGHPLEEAYSDRAISTHRDVHGAPISSSSQPAIMALMLRQLDPRPGQRVLEIGAGTGYNAALLAELVAPGGSVVAVDLEPRVAGEARARLAAAGARAVEVVAADGALGHPAGAPYDRIIVTCGPSDLPAAWWEQLAPGGRLVVPLTLVPGVALSCAFEREGDALVARWLEPCGFMPLRGELAGRPLLATGLDDGSTIALDPDPGLEAETLREWFSEPPVVRATELAAGSLHGREDEVEFRLTLATAGESAALLHVSADGLRHGRPAAMRTGRGREAWGSAYGIATARGVAVAGGVADGERLGVFGYGPEPPLDALEARLRAWSASGRGRRVVAVRAYPAGTEPPPAGGAQLVLARRWCTIVLDLAD